MKISEVMTREVTTLSVDASVKEALELMQKMQISGLPVVDRENRLVGMFTEKDILVYLLPSYVEKVGKFVYEQNSKTTKRKFAEIDRIKVSQLMRKEVLVVREDAALCEVAKTMIVQKTRRLPVVDKSGKIVGIVARPDVLRAFQREVFCS